LRRFKPTVLSVREPAWANPEQSAILLWLVTDAMDAELPFSADPNDVEILGRELFSRCIAGEFGAIAQFDASRSYVVNQTVNMPSYFDKSFLFYFDKLGTFFEESNVEVASGSVRGICLVNACMVETVVKRLVQALRKKNNLSEAESAKMIQKRVWRNNFESQNLMLEALGCVDRSQFEALDAIRKIRNEFSHQWRLSFADEAWKAKVLPLFDTLRVARNDGIPLPEFNLIEDLDFLTRMIFASACFGLVYHLLAEGYKEEIHSLEAF